MAMQMIIAETGKRETLSAVDQSTGVDWSREIIGNSGAIGDYIRYDRAADVYLISQDGYDWWVDYLMTVEADEQELSDLRDEYDGDTVQAMLNDEWYGSGHDYNDHHAINLRAFCRIRGAAA